VAKKSIPEASISRTKFPWPPLEPTVRTAVGSLLDAARQKKDH
jgi:hypothetical protein